MDNPQNDYQWKLERLGKVTASVIHKVLSDKTTTSKQLLLKSLVMERVSGTPTRHVKSSDMLRGLQLEPKAKAAYEKYTQSTIINTGFINHPNIDMAGASPDGLVLESGLIEIKCLNLRNHEQILKKQNVPKQYFNQIQFQLACTQRQWCDFVAFHPEADQSLFIKRVFPEHDTIQMIESKVELFLLEVDQSYLDLKQQNQQDLHQFI